LTDDLKAQIAERKQELLQYLRLKQSGFVPPPISPRTNSKPVPLSFAQERLWFLEQLDPGRAVYNICRAWRLTGKLNIAALQLSLKEVVRRHEILHSAIRILDGRPVQDAQHPFEQKLVIIDLPPRVDSEPNKQVPDRIRKIAETPFEFSSGKFLRAELIRVADDEHIFIIATHHIVSDAWSMGILTRELWSVYETDAAGKPSPLSELQVQYGDFAVWQRGWLQGEVLQSQLLYWKEQLKDHPVLNLPTDRPRPPRQSFRGARMSINLPEALTTAINDLSHQCGVTPFMTLLAAFKVLLCRYAGQEDIIVGTPVANRNRSELEHVIGLFVNTLVLRSDLSGVPSFKELLGRVREMCLSAYARQELPFEKLVEELKPERDQSRNPLFQVMFALQNATRQFGGISSLQVEPIELEVVRSRFDLSFFMREREGHYIGYIEYSTDLFNRDRIDRMAGHFHTLLKAIVADADQSIATLPILSERERQQVLIDWNDTAADNPMDKCIHELFEAQVERTPEAIAVTFDGKQLTYCELNARANQLAHYLQRQGLRPETLVGICVERSLEMVVGLLGILKAGAAYLPLDPAYPKQRLRFVLEDARASAMLTQESLVDRTAWSELTTQLVQVCLDRDWPFIDHESAENLPIQTTPENLAYVIYTSGSTGQPKGVAIEHRNTVNLLHWAKEVFAADEIAGVLASTSICFDLSAFEIFVPLCWGGKIVLVENVLSLIKTHVAGITLVNTVPSAMAALLAAGALPDSVRVANLAGEPLPPEVVDQLYQTGTIQKVYDLYGPSETTTYSTFALRMPSRPSTIGRPIANTRVYLLDSHMQPVPIGVPGELYIGGAGIARGYLGNPELTTEKFITDPFGNDGSSRVYRSGDLARYFPDGNIEFLGRTDNQVKIRGHRIELGEIEAVLNEHPRVEDNVIVARARGLSKEKDLIAYVVTPAASALPVTELRSFLQQKLPDYMVPSLFVELNALPLTPNGKIDRNALPPPNHNERDLARDFTEPRTEVEELVAQTWRDIFNIENLSIYDNFFELGGHSLLGMQLVAQLRETFDREIPLSALFEAPTVVGVSLEIEKLLRYGHVSVLPPIVPVPRKGPLPMSINQEYLWRLDRMIPGTHFFNMPYVYRLGGDLNVSALEKALQEIIRRHEALRTVFAEVNGYPVQIIKEPFEFQLPYTDLRGESADAVSEKAADSVSEERYGSFDLGTGPLLRVNLLRLTGADYLLLVTLHHIISDHWSMQVFRRELMILYRAYSEGDLVPLIEPAIQFGDYAVWERNLIDYGLFEQQLNYWQSNLAAPLFDLALSHEPRRMNHTVVSTTSKRFELTSKDFEALKMTAQSRRRTPFIYFMSALTIWLYYLTGTEDIRIVTLFPNRNSRESHRAMGPFANKVIFRMRVTGDLTIEELLTQVKNIMFAAHRNQELPFELLTHVLKTQRDLKQESMANVLALYNRTYSDALLHDGLYFAPINLQELVTQSEPLATSYDLTFKVSESSTRLAGIVNYKYQPSAYRVGVNATPVLMCILMSMVSAAGDRVIGRLLEIVTGQRPAYSA
jgi:amino acid adenylation domain-containing protein